LDSDSAQYGENAAEMLETKGRKRDDAASQRDASSEKLDIESDVRDGAAEARDALASGRDQAARLRDSAADNRDVAAARTRTSTSATESSSETSMREHAAADRKSSAGGRDAAASEREQASQDRDYASADRRAGMLARSEAAADRGASAADRLFSAQARASAAIDVLTGAYLRGPGIVEIEREMERAVRTASPLILAFVDVDSLKLVNDSRGHAAGDRLLRAVVRTLQESLRPYDRIVRYGGDEFVCALSGMSEADAVARFAAVNGSLSALPEPGSVTFGVATMIGGDSAASLLARADTELYRNRDPAHIAQRPITPAQASHQAADPTRDG
jgi:diguanylate cyclase (GGDEF)-like protein